MPGWLVNVLWQDSSRAVFSKQRLCLPCARPRLALPLLLTLSTRLSASYSPICILSSLLVDEPGRECSPKRERKLYARATRVKRLSFQDSGPLLAIYDASRPRRTLSLSYALRSLGFLSPSIFSTRKGFSLVQRYMRLNGWNRRNWDAWHTSDSLCQSFEFIWDNVEIRCVN